MYPLHSSFTTTPLHVIISIILQGAEKVRKFLTVTQQVCGSADAARECRRLITVLLSKEARVAGTQCMRARGEEEAGEASGGQIRWSYVGHEDNDESHCRGWKPLQA